MIKRLIRYALTIALLVFVWRHSHWSVALCLTLLSIETEINSEFTLALNEYRKLRK